MSKSRKRKPNKGVKGRTKPPAGRSATSVASPSPKGFVAELYAEDAKLFREVLSYLPLVMGALLVGKLRLEQPAIFLLIFAVVVAEHYLGLILSGVLRMSSQKYFVYLLHGAVVICVIVFYALTHSLIGGFLLAAYALLALCRRSVDVRSPRRVSLTNLSLVMEMMILAFLGAFSQTGEFFVPMILVGYIPGTYLFASSIALYADAFEQNGWERTRSRTQKGKVILRPAGLTRLFTLMLVVGPLVPILLCPLNRLPAPFLLCAFTIYSLPSIATGFFERLESDRLIAIRCVHLAFLSVLLCLASGFLSQL